MRRKGKAGFKLVDIISTALYVADNATRAAGCDLNEKMNSPTVFLIGF
jgi:hypothetical protein